VQNVSVLVKKYTSGKSYCTDDEGVLGNCDCSSDKEYYKILPFHVLMLNSASVGAGGVDGSLHSTVPSMNMPNQTEP
jgi:hypothetical protein